jgi:hypothetical protein
VGIGNLIKNYYKQILTVFAAFPVTSSCLRLRSVRLCFRRTGLSSAPKAREKLLQADVRAVFRKFPDIQGNPPVIRREPVKLKGSYPVNADPAVSRKRNKLPGAGPGLCEEQGSAAAARFNAFFDGMEAGQIGHNRLYFILMI